MSKGKYKQWLTKEGLTLLRGWKRAGLTDQQIYNKMEISETTYYAWLAKYPEMREAVKKGKQICDFETEEQLMGLFEGHYVTDTVTEINESNGTKKKHVRQTKRWVEPNVTAIIFYLKCRAGWKEQSQADQTEILNRLHDVFASVQTVAEKEH